MDGKLSTTGAAFVVQVTFISLISSVQINNLQYVSDSFVERDSVMHISKLVMYSYVY